MGIAVGFVPGATAVGSGLNAAEVALTTMEERGTAVGFSDFKVNEGKGAVVLDAVVGETDKAPLLLAPKLAPLDEN